MTASESLEVGAAAVGAVLGGLLGFTFVVRAIRALFTAAAS